MKNITNYHHRASLLFQSYLTQEISLSDLIQELRKIESLHRQSVTEEGSLWFKFSTDDTLVTSIDDLQKDLSNDNREFTWSALGKA